MTENNGTARRVTREMLGANRLAEPLVLRSPHYADEFTLVAADSSGGLISCSARTRPPEPGEVLGLSAVLGSPYGPIRLIVEVRHTVFVDGLRNHHFAVKWRALAATQRCRYLVEILTVFGIRVHLGELKNELKPGTELVYDARKQQVRLLQLERQHVRVPTAQILEPEAQRNLANTQPKVLVETVRRDTGWFATARVATPDPSTPTLEELFEPDKRARMARGPTIPMDRPRQQERPRRETPRRNRRRTPASLNNVFGRRVSPTPRRGRAATPQPPTPRSRRTPLPEIPKLRQSQPPAGVARTGSYRKAELEPLRQTPPTLLPEFICELPASFYAIGNKTRPAQVLSIGQSSATFSVEGMLTLENETPIRLGIPAHPLSTENMWAAAHVTATFPDSKNGATVVQVALVQSKTPPLYRQLVQFWSQRARQQ